MNKFILGCYDWIGQIVSGKDINMRNRTKLQYVTFFGTIIEIKRVNDNVVMYLIDDGTGVVGCRMSLVPLGESLQTLDMSRLSVSLEASTLCDSVFNDRTLQKDEMQVNKASHMQALRALRDNVYVTMNQGLHLQIGDIALVHGKMYNYFGTNQIYINVIRQINMAEELLLTRLKLERSGPKKSLEASLIRRERQAPSHDAELGQKSLEASLIRRATERQAPSRDAELGQKSRRPSGLMTFDTLSEASLTRVQPAVAVSSPLGPAGPFLPPPPGPPLSGGCTFDTLDQTGLEAIPGPFSPPLPGPPLSGGCTFDTLDQTGLEAIPGPFSPPPPGPPLSGGCTFDTLEQTGLEAIPGPFSPPPPGPPLSGGCTFDTMDQTCLEAIPGPSGVQSVGEGSPPSDDLFVLPTPVKKRPKLTAVKRARGGSQSSFK